MSEFAANNGERFPDARAWCDQLLPYVPDKEVFVCPSRPQLRCGYAFNSALGGVRYDSIKDPAKVVVIFETDRGWNAAGGPELLSAHDSRFPGYNIGFADGSVRLVSPLRE
jgi:prepilin-type processing-associated H-X9-DG protein